jgi:hypothetical protein
MSQIAEDFLQLSCYLNLDLDWGRHRIPISVEEFSFKRDIRVKGIIAVFPFLRVPVIRKAQTASIVQYLCCDELRRIREAANQRTANQIVHLRIQICLIHPSARWRVRKIAVSEHVDPECLLHDRGERLYD